MDQDLQTIEQSFDMIPEEVQRYIYSDAFYSLFTSLCTQEQLSKEETNQLHGALYGYLAQTSSEKELLETVNTISKSIDSNARIIAWIKKEVTDTVFELTTNTFIKEVEDEEEVEQATGSPLLQTPAQQPLASIKDFFVKPTHAAITKRDYSTEPSLPPQSIRTIDPYRELPDKE